MHAGSKLPLSFYRRDDVVLVARELLGKVLCVAHSGGLITGIITETEAYAGEGDRASHAFNGRRTARTEVMYMAGGVAYIYLCYGIHSLFNVVTNVSGIPDAVLLRSIYPLEGIHLMEKHSSGRPSPLAKMGQGPGKMTKIMGLHYSLSGVSLLGDRIWIEDRAVVIPATLVETGKRIGIDYAGEDAARPYRFWISDTGILKQVVLVKNSKQQDY